MSGRLLADQVEHAAGLAVEADLGRVIANVEDDLADDLFVVDGGGGGDFTGHNGHAGFDQGFAGHAGVLVLGNDGVEDGVRNLVGHLVRVAFGYGFRGKNGIFRHCACLLWMAR
jgi:hypothetical protein